MKYRLNKGFIVQKLDGEVTIFDGEESKLYTFNETASFIFQKLKLGWEKEKIVARLVFLYEISERKAKRDVNELIGDLKKKKIVSSAKTSKK